MNEAITQGEVMKEIILGFGSGVVFLWVTYYLVWAYVESVVGVGNIK